jgi:L-histidine N-alpha-methyltransferase
MQLSEIASNSRLNLQSVTPTRPLSDIVEDAQQGLLVKPRSIPPKYFYDQRGSELFDAICDTREYYPTRTEDALLRRHAQEIIQRAAPQHIIEFGSGTSRKTRRLLDVCASSDTAYWPFDVCEAMLKQTGEQLVGEYDWLDVNILVGDYLGGLQSLPVQDGHCLYLFLGGTIGNFTEREANWFLDELSDLMKPGDYLLLGADRIKDDEILHAAYNDSQGITAEFNLNLLQVLNRELEADFKLQQFEHKAEFNADAGQIEMYLESNCEQSVDIARLDTMLHMQQGERILTEISRKFTRIGLESLLTGVDLVIDNHYQPDDGYFSLVLSRKV